MSEQNENLTPLQRKLIKFYHQNTVIDYLKADVVPDEEGGVGLELTVAKEHTNLYGICHGGTMLTLADTVMGAVCLAAGKKVVTLDMNVGFLKPVPLGTHIKVTGKILHGGRRTVALESEVIDSAGQMFAKIQATFFVIGEAGEDD